MERIWTDSNYCISGGNVTDIMLMGISHNQIAGALGCEGRPAAGADVGNNMDGKMLKDIHSRQVPVIIYEDNRILTIADKIALSELFHAVDADGKKLKIEITDIRNQAGKTVEDIYEKAGIYEIEVRAEDAYEKQTVSCFRIPVNGGGI